MSKRQPGQVVLDAIQESIDGRHPWIEAQSRDELRAYRAAFKKMAGAKFFRGTGQPWVMDIDSRMGIEKDIMKARAVEARRKP